MAFLSRSLVQAESNYKIFDKELLAVVASFKEWRHYLEGNPNRLEVVVYTDHKNLETFMTNKQLTRQQARWAEMMGCFDFHIRFRPGKQGTKPDALSRRLDLEPTQDEKWSFGSMLKPENLSESSFNAEIDSFEAWFEGEDIVHEEVEEWFEDDIKGGSPQESYEIDAIDRSPTTVGPLWTDDQILNRIRILSAEDARIKEIIADIRNKREHVPKCYTVTDEVLYREGIVKFPDDQQVKLEILRTRHDSLLAGHPGRAKTLSLVQRQYRWPSMKAYINRYVDGFESSKRLKCSKGVWNT